ncbi:sugar phosphate isomerase/epimerase family protein [Bauldia sp.]|uniref:sugar phosphate isomerase/epimerase family protein n=1 Tax=Bauldia sp. TaxID=2575872 RepID=UPI003BAD7BD0
MQIGFFTSTLHDRPLSDVLDFAAEVGFDAVELDAGRHVREPERVADAVAAAKKLGLAVSSIAVVGNQLDPDRTKREAFRATTAAYCEASAAAGVPIVILFPGYDPSMSEDDNYADFAAHAQTLLADTQDSGLQLALENWPGPDNRFIGTTPAGLKKLFAAIPDTRFGIEFDPSHFVRLGIDHMRAYDEVADRVKMLHAKDTSIDKEVLQQVGYHGENWWRYRLPGRGLIDWPAFIAKVRQHGFDGTIAIEHEDADYGWPRGDWYARIKGETEALNFLRELMTP